MLHNKGYIRALRRLPKSHKLITNLLKPVVKSNGNPTSNVTTTTTDNLSDILLDLSKSSSILHSPTYVTGYTRPDSSVVSKEPTNVFDERKLFYNSFDSVFKGKEDPAHELSKRVSLVMQSQGSSVVHKLDSGVSLFTSNENVDTETPIKKSTSPKKAPVYVRKLSEEEDNTLKVDLDSVLSFLNKNVR